MIILTMLFFKCKYRRSKNHLSPPAPHPSPIVPYTNLYYIYVYISPSMHEPTKYVYTCICTYI